MADKTETPDTERVASVSDAKQEEVELVTAENGNSDVPEDNMTSNDGDGDGDTTAKEESEEKVEDRKGTGAIDQMQSKLERFDEALEDMRDKKYSKSECLCFFTFLIVFTTMAVLGRGVSDVSFTQTITIRQSLIERDEFIPWNDRGEKTFSDASTIEDIYHYLEQVAIPFLLRPPDYYVQSQQALLGGIRLKQLRMTPESCDKKEFEDCFDTDYFKGRVDFYYPNGGYATNFTYIDSMDIKDQSWRGKYGTYPGGGFIVTLPLDYESSLAYLAYLKNISWLDGGTRFLALDFNTYNPSTSLHTVARLAWEMPTGGVFPNDEIKTWKFERYSGADGAALAAFHVLYLIWVLGMTFMAFRECYNMGCLKCGKNKDGTPSYWNSKWKGIDAINLVFFYVSICLFIVNEDYRVNKMNLYSVNKYVSFRQLQYGFTLESYSTAINGALLWIKLFKYLAVNKRLRFLFTMLGRSSTDILMFAIVLGVFVVAFGTAGFLTFNSDVDDFRSYVFSMSNMVRFTLVDMDYSALSLSSRLWGSLFYFLWSLLMLLILANVFIAILTEAYSQIQMELTDDDKIDLNFFGMGGALGKLRTTIAATINKTVRVEAFDDDGDGKVSAAELAAQTNITEERAKEIIAEYDKDGDGQLDEEEFEILKQQIIDERVAEAEAAEQQKIAADALRGSPRAVDVGHGIPSISSKEFEDLKSEVNDIMELLTAVLDQTPAGKRALKLRENEKSNKVKHAKRSSAAFKANK